MCATCGCGDPSGSRVRLMTAHGQPSPLDRNDHDHQDHHDHEHTNGHGHQDREHPDNPDRRSTVPADGARTVTLEARILAKNDALAAQNRAWLAERGIVALNVMSSPGSGKTTLLQRTIAEHTGARVVSVIEGDQETVLDAERIRGTGAPVVQINTGAGCHLDADMLRRGLEALQPATGSLVFVENVGNLVCPALFDLGESAKVVVISVTEGDDKPLKYPHMFASADLVIVNKTDLLPYVDFDVETCSRHARALNPGVTIVPLSATTGDGMARWADWLSEHFTEGPRLDRDR